MRKILALLLALPLLLSGSEAIKLHFQEGAKHIYEFTGYFPFSLLEQQQSKRVKVAGKLQLEVDELLEDGGAFISAVVSDFKVDTETELGNQLVNMVLDSMMNGGRAIWRLSSKGELLEFTSDSFFFSDYANQLIALGLFSPVLRGALEEGKSSVTHTKGLNQFEIEYEAAKIAGDLAVIGFQISSEKIEKGKQSRVSATLRGTFDLNSGWAREACYDIHCQHSGMKNKEENHFTFWVTRIDNAL